MNAKTVFPIPIPMKQAENASMIWIYVDRDNTSILSVNVTSVRTTPTEMILAEAAPATSAPIGKSAGEMEDVRTARITPTLKHRIARHAKTTLICALSSNS